MVVDIKQLRRCYDEEKIGDGTPFSLFIQLIKINIIIENAKSQCNRIIKAKTKRGRFLKV